MSSCFCLVLLLNSDSLLAGYDQLNYFQFRITDFKEKAELFNHFDLINFSSDTAKTTSCLDPNKAHGHDMVSIWVIKLCGNTFCKPLSIFFTDCLSEGKFPH